jgi:hypothetical protein
MGHRYKKFKLTFGLVVVVAIVLIKFFNKTMEKGDRVVKFIETRKKSRWKEMFFIFLFCF